MSEQTRKIRLPWSAAVVGICASLATYVYHCSQLVWRAWLNQGNDIDYITADSIVTPAELVNSPATVTLWATNG